MSTDAEKVVKALRDRARVSAAFDRPAGEDVRAEINALADYVEAAKKVRELYLWGSPCPACQHADCVPARAYDAALARLLEVLNG